MILVDLQERAVMQQALREQAKRSSAFDLLFTGINLVNCLKAELFYMRNPVEIGSF
jgi:hypothetical protein